MRKRRTADLPRSYLHPSQHSANGTFLLWCTSTQTSWWFITNTDHHRMLSPPGPRSTTLGTENKAVFTAANLIPGSRPTMLWFHCWVFKINCIMCLTHSRAMGFAAWQATYVRVTYTAAWTYQGIWWALIKDLASPIPPTKWDKTGLSNVVYARNWSSPVATVILSKR